MTPPLAHVRFTFPLRVQPLAVAAVRDVPLPSNARCTFPLRGTCDTCGRQHVCCMPRHNGNTYSVSPEPARTMVCASCVMTGRA